MTGGWRLVWFVDTKKIKILLSAQKKEGGQGGWSGS
jgi:hypothetical protein